MGSACCLCVCIPLNNPGIMGPEETTVARQQLGKYFPVRTSTNTTIEEMFVAVFSKSSLPYRILKMQ
jgi:hypothetical protein